MLNSMIKILNENPELIKKLDLEALNSIGIDNIKEMIASRKNYNSGLTYLPVFNDEYFDLKLEIINDILSSDNNSHIYNIEGTFKSLISEQYKPDEGRLKILLQLLIKAEKNNRTNDIFDFFEPIIKSEDIYIYYISYILTVINNRITNIFPNNFLYEVDDSFLNKENLLLSIAAINISGGTLVNKGSKLEFFCNNEKQLKFLSLLFEVLDMSEREIHIKYKK